MKKYKAAALALVFVLMTLCSQVSFALGYAGLTRTVEPGATLKVTVVSGISAGWEEADIETSGVEYVSNTGPGNSTQIVLEPGQSSLYTYKVAAGLGETVSITWTNIREMDPELGEFIPTRDLKWTAEVRQSAASDGPYQYDLIGEDSIVITQGPLNAENGILDIPETIDGYTVRRIGESAFQNEYSDTCNLTTVTIPDTVTQIDDDAFLFMETLETVHLPADLLEIGQRAFSGCGLTTLDLPDKLQEIGQNAFGGISIASLDIPASVTKIGFDAFSGCDQLESVTYPDTAVETGERAFSQCTSLSEVTLPARLKTISPGTFGGCTALKTIDLPENLTLIESEAFAGSGLTQIHIPASVEGIGEDAFAGCRSLESVQMNAGLVNLGVSAFAHCSALKAAPALPDTLEEIGEAAFMGCTSMTDAAWPSSISVIPDSAFEACRSLKTITIPDSVTEIRYAAFAGATALETVYYGGTEEQWDRLQIGQPDDPTDESNIALYRAKIIFGDDPGPDQPDDPGPDQPDDPGPDQPDDPGPDQPDDPGPDDPGTVTEIPIPKEVDEFPGGVAPAADSIARPAEAAGNYYVVGYTVSRDPLPVTDAVNCWLLPEETDAVMLTSYGLPVETGAILRTGETLQIASPEDVLCDAKVVVRGDVTGSGILNLTQLVRLAQAFTGTRPLEGPYAVAGDMNRSGKLDLTDLVQLARLLTADSESNSPVEEAF